MKQRSSPITLNAESLGKGLRFLCSADKDLARIHDELGPPPLWDREPGFPTLVYIILEQQVSLASARAAFNRLRDCLVSVTPESFLVLSDDKLKRIGFSRQKSGYCRGLARSILSGEIDLESLVLLDDQTVRNTLLKIKGIGAWTADIYLLMALLRQDIWPQGDLALATAMQEVKGLPTRPESKQMDEIATPWRPWRAVAARLLWQYYLSSKTRA